MNKQACENGRGAVLLSVARGKVSEGIDFGNVFYIHNFIHDYNCNISLSLLITQTIILAEQL